MALHCIIKGQLIALSYQKSVNCIILNKLTIFSKTIDSDSSTLKHSIQYALQCTGVCSMHYAALVGVYAVYFDAERDCFLFVNIESILPPSSLVQMCFVFISYGSLQWVAFECITVNSKCIYM